MSEETVASLMISVCNMVNFIAILWVFLVMYEASMNPQETLAVCLALLVSHLSGYIEGRLKGGL